MGPFNKSITPRIQILSSLVILHSSARSSDFHIYCTNHFSDESFKHLVYEMSKNVKQGPLQLPKTRGRIIKLLNLSDQQLRAERLSFILTKTREKQSSHFKMMDPVSIWHFQLCQWCASRNGNIVVGPPLWSKQKYLETNESLPFMPQTDIGNLLTFSSHASKIFNIVKGFTTIQYL